MRKRPDFVAFIYTEKYILNMRFARYTYTDFSWKIFKRDAGRMPCL